MNGQKGSIHISRFFFVFVFFRLNRGSASNIISFLMPDKKKVNELTDENEIAVGKNQFSAEKNHFFN